MAGQEWRDWFEREELIGQISDIRVQNLQVEREVVQKRTFTRWMNLHLEKCNPPLVVQDLFRDIKDGRVLMALLEELSGSRLLHEFKPSSHRIFRLNNIARVLRFLEERNVKLVSIDASDVADGNPSIVLGLIWNIILFFQIKELTGNIRNQFPSTSSLSSIPNSSDSDVSQSSTPSDDRKPSVSVRDHGRAIKTLLQWVQKRTKKYGVAVHDFGKSWASGLAFLAVIKSIDPSLVDMSRAMLQSPRENIEEAFRTAHYSLGIARLLEPEDVTLSPPDQQSIMTYVSQFLEHFPGIEEDEPSDFRERSKVSPRSTEPPFRTGNQRKREKSVVKRDWVQPPPKIFISSVAEERERKRPPVRTRVSEDRPWDSEDSSMGSSPSITETHPLSRPLSLKKEASSSPSSSQPQSLIDSAVDSADSWADTASKVPQSCSVDSLKDVSSPGDLTSLGSPLDSEIVSQESFVDDGNFSLSLEPSALLSEEEDAYRYILDLKEDESPSDLPSEDLTNKSNVQETSPENPQMSKPTPSYGDYDSGFFPDQKEGILTTQTDDVSEAPPELPLEEDASQDQAERFEEASGAEVSTEANNTSVFDDDAEYHVVQYERISISGSEEDTDDLCAELDEEAYPEETSISDCFGADTSAKDVDPHEDYAEKLPSLKEIDDIDQIMQDQLEYSPEPELDYLEPGHETDEVCTELELPQTSSDPLISTNTSQPGTAEIDSVIQKDEAEQIFTERPEISERSGTAETEAEIQVEVEQPSSIGIPDRIQEPVLEDLGEINQKDDKLEETSVSKPIVSENLKNQSDPFPEDGENIIGHEEPSQLVATASMLDDSLNGLENKPIVIEEGHQDAIIHTDEPQTNTQPPSPSTLTKPEPKAEESELLLSLSTSSMEDQLRDKEPEPVAEEPQQVLSPLFTKSMEDQPRDKDPEPVAEENEQLLSLSLSSMKDQPRDDKLELVAEENNLVLSPSTSSMEDQARDDEPEPPAEENEQPPSPSFPERSGLFTDDENEEQEDSKTFPALDRMDRNRAELRLALSVTPLQPAPAQPALTEQSSQDKVDEGGVESPMQSPFGLWVSPSGDWGAVETDQAANVSELNKRNKKQDNSSPAAVPAPSSAPEASPASKPAPASVPPPAPISASPETPAPAPAPAPTPVPVPTARKKAVTPSPKTEEAVSESTGDKKQPSTNLEVQKVPEAKQEKKENGVSPAAIPKHDESVCVKCNRKVSSCKQRTDNTYQPLLSDMDLLLIMWLLVFLLLVLPHMDLWDIPRVLFNMDK
ncbi:calmin-like [Trichomycterus rosablanca]|uniref:calmin-like n=1 Tax=Trichomycterus rosablanca TaxID=2290929 RepID=UPI002F350CF8